MKKILFLVVALIMSVTNVWAADALGSIKHYNELTDGMEVALRGCSNSNTNYLYLNGDKANNKLAFDDACTFVLESDGNGKFYLKNKSTGKYIGKSGTDVTVVTSSASATAFALQQVTSCDDKNLNVSLSDVTRFVDGDMFLNCQASGADAKFSNGTGAWSFFRVYQVVEPVPVAGKVYTIKAHFTNESYTDLYLTSSTSAEQLLVPMPSTATANQSYWVAEASGNTDRPWKFKSGYGYAKYLDWQSGTNGLSANGDNFGVLACSSVAGTYHLNVSTNDRNIGTWGNNNDTKKGFGAVGSGGCWAQNKGHSNATATNYWATDYEIVAVAGVTAYKVSCNNANGGVTPSFANYAGVATVKNGGYIIVPDGIQLTSENCPAVKRTGLTESVNINDNDKTITVTYKTFLEVAGTRYVTIENKDTGRMPFLYNDIQYTDEITLQAANTNNMTNGYIWKVTSDGEGNITVLNAENGKGIKPSAGNHCSSNITAFQVTAGANAGYYNLINSTAITNGHDRLNAAKSTGDYHNEANLRAVTTWTGTSNDNEWKFNVIDTEGLTEYTVSITQPASCRGYAVYNSKKAANGGFFLAPADLQQSAVSAAEFSGYTSNVTINGNTIEVEYTASTVDYTVNITGATDATVTFEGTPYTASQTITATGLTPSQLTASYAEGYYAPEISIEGNVITVAYTALPFQVGDHYYTMKSNYNNYVFDGTNAWYNNSVEVKGKNHLWQFEHVDGTLDLYMLKTYSGKYGVLSGSGRNALTFADSPTEWTSGTGATSYFRVVAQNGGFDLQHPGDARTNVGSHVDGKLGSWLADNSASHAASINKVEEVTPKTYTVTITGAPAGETPSVTYEGTSYVTDSKIENALGLVKADLTLSEYSDYECTVNITDEAINVTYKSNFAELQNKIDAAMENILADHVGYPNRNAQENTVAINELAQWQNIGLGSLINSSNYEEALAAYNAVIALTNINLPVDGKAYYFVNVQQKSDTDKTLTGNKYMLKYNSSNSNLATEAYTGQAPAESNIFIARQVEGNRFVFVTNDGHYLRYYGSNDNRNGALSDTYSVNDGSVNIYKQALNGVNTQVPIEECFGYITLNGYRNNSTQDAPIIIFGKTGAFNATSGAIIRYNNENDQYSTAFSIIEATYAYNHPKLVASKGENEAVDGVYASIYLPFAMQFPEGVEVYAGTEETNNEDNVTYLKLTKANDENGIVAKGAYILRSATLDANTTITVTPAAANPTGIENPVFFGTTDPAIAETKWSSYKTMNPDKTPYILANKDTHGIGFYKLTGEVCPMGKAVWMAPSNTSAAVKFSFEEIISAIEALHGNTTNAAIYDLQGRRLDKVQKGHINVINGQKIMFK